MFTYTLTDNDGESFTVHADSRDVVRWERTSDEGEVYTDLIRDGRRSLARHYRLAHIAARRHGAVDGDMPIEVFEDRYVMDVKAEDTKVRPTKGEASTATSSSSRSGQASPQNSGPAKARGRSPRRSTSST